MHSSLNAEIRLRKFTFTKIKADCPLFKQRNLTIDQKGRSLINAQLNLKTLADMTDLESAIMNATPTDDSLQSVPVEPTLDTTPDTLPDTIDADTGWPPKKDDFISMDSLKMGLYLVKLFLPLQMK